MLEWIQPKYFVEYLANPTCPSIRFWTELEYQTYFWTHRGALKSIISLMSKRMKSGHKFSKFRICNRHSGEIEYTVVLRKYKEK